MTARTVLLIPGAFSNLDAGDHLPLIADRRADGGLVLTTLDETTRINLHADDLAELARFALPPAPQIRVENGETKIALFADRVGDTNLTTGASDPAPAPPDPAPATPRKRGPQPPADMDAFRDEVFAILRAISEDGQMPSQRDWDAKRPPHLPTQTTVRTRLGCNWVELAQRVGLTVAPARFINAHRANAALAAKRVDAATQRTEAAPPPAPVTNGHSNGFDAAVKAAAAKRDAVRTEAVAVLRDMGNGAGRMPSMKEYNALKPAHLPKAGDLMNYLALDHWGEMAKLAGLVWKPGEK